MTVWTTGFVRLGHSLTFPAYDARLEVTQSGRCMWHAAGEAGPMTDRTYTVSEIVGTSPESVQQAIRNGVRRAGETIRHLEWFEVTQIRGNIVDGDVEHFQVQMKVGFRLEDN